jgi:hypothetical protein
MECVGSRISFESRISSLPLYTYERGVGQLKRCSRAWVPDFGSRVTRKPTRKRHMVGDSSRLACDVGKLSDVCVLMARGQRASQ